MKRKLLFPDLLNSRHVSRKSLVLGIGLLSFTICLDPAYGGPYEAENAFSAIKNDTGNLLEARENA